jgi:peptide/nickel transport system ATP-binding protein
MTVPPPLLELDRLSVAFRSRKGSVTALDDISLTVGRSEILGVVGESGAGKSLTGAAVIGLLPGSGHITGGEIRLDGRRIDTLAPDAMRKVRGREIGSIFQDPLTSLNPLYTVAQQLVQTIRVHLDLTPTQARARALDLLKAVGIPAAAERLDSYPHEFSGGMRQRVVIALALAADPKLIIADEPTTALDVSVQAQIIALIKTLCRENGTAAMLITHDMGVIAETADRVAVLYAGRLVEIGEVGTVVRAPRHPYTRGLMDSIPPLETKVDRLVQIAGSMPGLTALPTGCAFHPRCPRAAAICATATPSPRPVGDGAVACWFEGSDAA